MPEKTSNLPSILQEAIGIAEFKRTRKEHVILRKKKKTYPVIRPIKSGVFHYFFPEVSSFSRKIGRTNRNSALSNLDIFRDQHVAELKDIVNLTVSAGVGVDLYSLIHNIEVSTAGALVAKIAVNGIVYATRKDKNSNI